MGPCLIRHGNSPPTPLSSRRILASMGPCLIRHGNRELGRGARQGIRASMGPCLIRHGNGVRRDLLVQTEPASMGPCLIRHGNPAPRRRGRIRSDSFNGAVPHKARKSGREDLYQIAALQGFNGAVPHKARKSDKYQGVPRSTWHASMGPCLIRHGNSARCFLTRMPHWRLQWGRAS